MSDVPSEIKQWQRDQMRKRLAYLREVQVQGREVDKAEIERLMTSIQELDLELNHSEGAV